MTRCCKLLRASVRPCTCDCDCSKQGYPEPAVLYRSVQIPVLTALPSRNLLWGCTRTAPLQIRYSQAWQVCLQARAPGLHVKRGSPTDSCSKGCSFGIALSRQLKAHAQGDRIRLWRMAVSTLTTQNGEHNIRSTLIMQRAYVRLLPQSR